MPIPLAHPVAVLPLWRYFTRHLNLPALVIGSVVSDVGYFFDDPGLGTLSHQFPWGIAFGLPIGVIAVAALYAFRTAIVEKLPSSQKRIFLPLCRRPIGPLWIVVVSLIVGICTHLLWDSFTHKDGWIVMHSTILQLPILKYEGHNVRVCHLLWYGCSFSGVGWLYLEFEKWKSGNALSRPMLRNAIVVAILVVPISLIHHLVSGALTTALTAALCALLMLTMVLKEAS